ncbi:hypothetical protein PHPALM_28671 [Phytophthora palmivora]|uniref:RxLR effector protein n=1 Tax=Phytophthora palmivora TaxID=4796 RepID=A0A2P4X9H7_9STRA|nr:hypothetical protein PHPALM_28671 [Phytophthora palmivora]
MRSSYAIFIVVAATLITSSNAGMTSRSDQITLSGVDSPDHQLSEATAGMGRLLRSGDDTENDADSEERGFEAYYKMWHSNKQTSAAIKNDLGIAGLRFRYGKGSEKLLAREEYQKWKGYKKYLKDHPLD